MTMTVPSPDSQPKIASVRVSQIVRWLQSGIQDFHHANLASLFYGLMFSLSGILIHRVFITAHWLLSALITGFFLLGPFLAMGLYALSKQLEMGEKPALIPTLSIWRVNIKNVGIFAGVLLVIFMIWARASMVIFALFFHGTLPTFKDVVFNVITFQDPVFTTVYFGVGGFFAALTFSLSVIAMPLMFDRQTDAVTAAIASFQAVLKNPLPLLTWAVVIVAFVGIGFATYYIGLVILMPIIGHATWHAYRDLVKP